MWCGWLPRETWPEAPDLPKYPIDGEVQCPPVCPGWLQRQPLVVETAQAWRAFDKGCLGDAFPDAPSVLIEAVFTMDAEVSRHQADQHKQAQHENPTS